MFRLEIVDCCLPLSCQFFHFVLHRSGKLYTNANQATTSARNLCLLIRKMTCCGLQWTDVPFVGSELSDTAAACLFEEEDGGTAVANADKRDAKKQRNVLLWGYENTELECGYVKFAFADHRLPFVVSLLGVVALSYSPLVNGYLLKWNGFVLYAGSILTMITAVLYALALKPNSIVARCAGTTSKYGRALMTEKLGWLAFVWSMTMAFTEAEHARVCSTLERYQGAVVFECYQLLPSKVLAGATIALPFAPRGIASMISYFLIWLAYLLGEIFYPVARPSVYTISAVATDGVHRPRAGVPPTVRRHCEAPL